MARGLGALPICMLLLAAAAALTPAVALVLGQSGTGVPAWRALLQQATAPPPAPAPPAPCFDRPTPEGFTCEQQKGWGKCSESWMVDGGFCRRTCNLCSLPQPPAAEAPAGAAAEGPGADSVRSVPPATEGPTNSSFCTQPAKTGPCRSAMPAWFWDNEAATCRPFLYGGCQGNDNRFDGFEVCQAASERFCFSGP